MNKDDKKENKNEKKEEKKVLMNEDATLSAFGVNPFTINIKKEKK
jgi:hypothetical protein